MRTPTPASSGSSTRLASGSGSASGASTRVASSSGSSQGVKRKAAGGVGAEPDVDSGRGSESSRIDKRLKADNLQSNPKYKPQDRDMKETATTPIIGEDPEDEFDPDDENQNKPIRYLSGFALFDPKRALEMVSLDALNEAGDHNYEAAGYVAPMFVNEEDAGQEDEDEEEVMQRLRTSRVLSFWFDYTIADDKIFRQFYLPRRVVQIIVSSVLANPGQTHDEFKDVYLDRYDEFMRARISTTLIDDATPILRQIIPTLQQAPTLRNSPLIKHLLGRDIPSASSSARSSLVPQNRPRLNGRLFTAQNIFAGNIDLAVLRPENQNPTHVTSLIERLAEGFFREHFVVRQKRLKLLRYFTEDRRNEKKVSFPGREQLDGVYWKAVVVDEETFRVGDCVVARGGAYQNRAEPEMPIDVTQLREDASAPDYFWFGKIIFINQQTKQMHVQWFEHASKSILQEYSDMDGSFTSIPAQNQQTDNVGPPDNCPACAAHDDTDDFPQEIKNGFAFQGTDYHISDFVLYKTDDQVCGIGQIMDIEWKNSVRHDDRDTMIVKALGRVSDVVGKPGCPDDVIKDERHLYFTDVLLGMPLSIVLHKCSVLHPLSLDAPDFETYLTTSPYNFYVTYKFPDLNHEVLSWESATKLRYKDVGICGTCGQNFLDHKEQMKAFMAVCAKKPLRVFDPFGGVGAFSAGLEQAGVMKMTHAVEISPSAAETLKKNFPGVVVYNQCSNIMLRYAIKKHERHDVETPKSLYDQSPVADPPRTGSIDCIVAGFPCQPHSRLNMFQRADDKKSHLILNLCAWVDFLRPKYCFFENVRGFLQYSLNSTQAGRYRVEGGIEMGGLKWLIHALLEMNYQVRYGLLQAAHYGTPQSRVRFFLIASQHNTPLPAFPMPVYAFPEKDALEIRSAKLPRPIAPIFAATKVVHNLVTIEDAIGDLPQFDWKHPRRIQQQRKVPHPDDPDANFYVSALACDKSKAFVGYSGPNAVYHTEPKTVFQRKCREKPLVDLQHYTRVLKEQVVERVLSIPLEAKADYRTLKQNKWEWQFSNPSSAVARDGFRPGLYGRLDKNAWFHTTVTNVEPTAKQSWLTKRRDVQCNRVVTVRELARSQGFPDHFVFVSKNNDVKTMQRQIGNAVPWPVSLALGRELRDTMLKKWVEDQKNAIEID
ncbi:hypothetical protein EUX98_g8210 [Antrodiella citrinella]|uniref:DNA (cytosine-5-)-methyltransferase n=1 Tax=Antrodiella citrinella TaxID=2447956 RepID=A0A4S4MC80_9APHY|nr:hypothetical protein EUX98_g8210 [Antrodiella citrinella]